MGPASKILSLALGIPLAMAAAQSSAHALIQEPNAPSGNQTSSSDSALKEEAKPPDKKPDDKVAPTQASDETAQPGGPEKQAVASGGGKDEKGKAAGSVGTAKNAKKAIPKARSEAQQLPTEPTAGGASEVKKTAQQVLGSLDVAIGLAQKSGAKLENDVSVRRSKLQQKVLAAQDDNAWAVVASDAAGILTDTLQRMDANSGGLPPEAQEKTDHAASQVDDREAFLRSPQLPLYIAVISLVFSLLGLGSGWLLARREINKALVEAGLI